MGGDKGEGETSGLFTPTPPASPERLAMAGRLNPPPSRGRRFSRQVSDAPRFNAGSFLPVVTIAQCGVSIEAQRPILGNVQNPLF
jgi:hypothetical protein